MGHISINTGGISLGKFWHDILYFDVIQEQEVSYFIQLNNVFSGQEQYDKGIYNFLHPNRVIKRYSLTLYPPTNFNLNRELIFEGFILDRREVDLLCPFTREVIRPAPASYFFFLPFGWINEDTLYKQNTPYDDVLCPGYNYWVWGKEFIAIGPNCGWFGQSRVCFETKLARDPQKFDTLAHQTEIRL